MSDMPPPPPDDPGWSSQPPAPPPPDDPGWSSQPPAPPPLVEPSTSGGVPGARTAALGTGETVELASPGTRLTARIADLLILAIVTAILQRVAESGLDSVATAVGFVAAAAYETAFTAIKGQTPGKMATRIRVVRASNGAVPDWGASAARWALPSVASLASIVAWYVWVERTTTSVISAVLFIIFARASAGLVYASLLWHKRRQGWHDMVARTLVTNTPEQTARSNRVAIGVGIAFVALAVLLPVVLILALISTFGP